MEADTTNAPKCTKNLSGPKSENHGWAKPGIPLEIQRFQLKRGLFWYRHRPKMHEMVLDRSSRADFLTKVRKNSMRICFVV